MRSLTLPDCIRVLEKEALAGCRRLEKITLGKRRNSRLHSIEKEVFCENEHLKTIYLKGRNLQKVYADNFGDIPEGDITQVDENTIPDHDILCAGFPCQAFSISGKQRGFEDSRGTLFFDVARIVKAKKPKVVFMENVKNFATHDHGKTLEVV